MKKAYSILIVLAMPLSLILFSYVNGSPGGKTGSPGDSGATCTECHTGTAQTQLSWIASTIPVEGYTPGATYQVTATGTHAGVVRFGFELTSEDALGDKTGHFTITDVERTKLANGGKSVTHKMAGTSPGGDSNTWTVDWTAPASGSVTFYAAFNAANGNGSTSGDVIYTSSLMVSQMVLNPQIAGVDPNHVPLDFNGNLTITGQDTQWESETLMVSFLNHDDQTTSFSASNVTVESNTLLTVSVMIPISLPVGSYDVYVGELMLENGLVVDQLDAVESVDWDAEVKIYPNPATQYLFVNAPMGSEIDVLDIQGRLLQSTTMDQKIKQIDVVDYNQGLYFLVIKSEGKQSTRKWLKTN